MSPTLSHSTSLDRKSLKRPDDFTQSVRGGFDWIANRSRQFLAGVAVVTVVAVAGSAWMTRSSARSMAARNQLFKAQQALDVELKKLSPTETASKVDVDAKLGAVVTQFQSVVDQYGSTRAGFEALLALGDLYLEHGDASKSVGWYEKAVLKAPAAIDKALSYYALGYAFETLGKSAEAIQNYQRALTQGDTGLKGDILLAIARSHESTKDFAQAKAVYEQITQQLPNSEFSKLAEAYRGLLE